MSTDKISIPKLKGISNYETWALRVCAFLTREGQRPAISQIPPQIEQDLNDKALANIQLTVEDGPLLQIQNLATAKEAWEAFQNLYSPKGFTSEFLICREFFEATLNKYSSMEEYLNKVKQLSDQLKAKKLDLPRQVIIAWVLNNLTDNYDGFVSNITQSLRNDSNVYTLETLFSNLLDESKRQESKESNTVLHTKTRPTFKVVKKKPQGKHCKYCKLGSYDVKDCYFLFLERAPKNWKKKFDAIENSVNEAEKTPREKRDENVEVLYSKSSGDIAIENDTIELDLDVGDMNLDFEDIQVLITMNNPNNITNNSLDKLMTRIEEERSSIERIKVLNAIERNNYTANFILDCGSTRNIIADRSYFTSFQVCNKVVSWGHTKSIAIKGSGNICIEFIDIQIKVVFKNCLFMPELGVNLISQTQFNKNIYSILNYKYVYLMKGKTCIIKGDKIENLYYLSIKVYKNEQALNITTNNNIDNNIIWHQRMGHININSVNKLPDAVIGLKTTAAATNHNIDNCEICLKAKFTNKINHKTTNNYTYEYLEKVGNDLCRPIKLYIYNGYKYFITFIEKSTRYIDIELLKTKDEVYNVFYKYKQLAENNENNKRIRIYSIDNGGEFVNNRFKRLFTENGIKHQTSTLHTHEQNGLMERINRTIMNKARALLYNANLPKYL